MKIWQAVTGEPWAMTASALQNVLDIASRKIGTSKESVEAIEAKMGQPLDNAHTVSVRDGMAIIPVTGPLFRYANIFTRVSGATSYELLAQDIMTAVEDPAITQLILTIDSPGGEVNGCAELAELIAEVKTNKPILAYVCGDAASGAYWIASACTEIVASATSGLGSIGVVGVYRRDSEEKNTTIEIVSSQSPYKRLHIDNDDDRGRIQSRIDTLADVFIQAVATYRGIDSQTVIEDYGGGDIFIGAQAVEQGLADRLGTFEKLLTELTNPAIERGSSFMASTLNTTEELPMANDDTDPLTTSDDSIVCLDLDTLKADYPALVSAIADEATEQGMAEGLQAGKVQERLRLSTILTAEESIGREALAHYFAFETELPMSDAIAALSASPKNEISMDENSPGFEQLMASMNNPDIEPAAETETVSEDVQVDDAAKRIAASMKG